MAQPKYPTTRRCDSRQTAAAVGCSLPEKDGGAACRCRTVAVLGSNSDPPCDRLRPPADLQLALHRWSLQALTSLACDWPRPTTALCIYILHSLHKLSVCVLLRHCQMSLVSLHSLYIYKAFTRFIKKTILVHLHQAIGRLICLKSHMFYLLEVYYSWQQHNMDIIK